MSMSKSNARFIVKKIYENGVITYLAKENNMLNFTDDRNKSMKFSYEFAENMKELFADDGESYPVRFEIVIEKIETDINLIPQKIFTSVSVDSRKDISFIEYNRLKKSKNMRLSARFCPLGQSITNGEGTALVGAWVCSYKFGVS